MQLKKTFLSAKNGDSATSEDCIHISNKFMAVIYGATSKSGLQWNEQTGGQFVAHTINDALTALPSNSTVLESVAFISKRVKKAFASLGIGQAIAAGKTEPPAAVFCALSIKRRELWMVGDCRKIPENTKRIILATDGYPLLKPSLEESEEHLANLLKRDPLLFREFKPTKGLIKGHASFDDRV